MYRTKRNEKMKNSIKTSGAANLAIDTVIDAVIVAFQIGRGGRFNQSGHSSYIGEKDLQDLISMNSDRLFVSNRDDNGRFVKSRLLDESQNIIVENEDLLHSLVGTLNFDNDYDTFKACYVDDCSEEELDLISKSNSFKSQELKDYLNNL